MGSHGFLGKRLSGTSLDLLIWKKDDFSRFLREAGKQEIVITRHGKSAGVLIGFASEDEWLDWRLENDSRFLRPIDKARRSLREGRGVRLEDLPG